MKHNQNNQKLSKNNLTKSELDISKSRSPKPKKDGPGKIIMTRSNSRVEVKRDDKSRSPFPPSNIKLRPIYSNKQKKKIEDKDYNVNVFSNNMIREFVDNKKPNVSSSKRSSPPCILS